MKICSKCGAQMNDNAVFCTHCGARFEGQNAGTEAPGANGSYNNYAGYNGGYPSAPADPYDHTAEFTAKDISDNKVMAMLVYLMGTIGVIIALLASNTSPYAAFHVRQALKFTVLKILIGIISLLLCWTIIVPIAGGIAAIVLFVVKIICFFSICQGKAKEPPIIRSFDFLR